MSVKFCSSLSTRAKLAKQIFKQKDYYFGVDITT